ncbi:hypothetical protein ACHAWF_016400 [Thalassiosira exigua]
MSILMNYTYYLEFLGDSLRKKGKNEKPGILQRNLFVILSSAEMISLVRLLSIIHLSVCIPIRWLAGKTHELRPYGWGPMSMGRVLDTLEEKMKTIARNPKKVLEEDFMMSMFSEYVDELPPLKEYLDLLFKKKQMCVIARKSGTKVVHLARLRKQLFTPTFKTEQNTSTRVKELAKVAAEAILTELRDPKKATHKYLSSSGTEYSWKHCSSKRKSALLEKKP